MERPDYLDRIKLVSGGQTGIDRAVLDHCLDHGQACGGWCPAGRMAEDGIIPARYPVVELPGAGYADRTAANVSDSDATVVIFFGDPKGGTLLSLELARRLEKPLLLLDLATASITGAARLMRQFILTEQPGILNISGPRRSEWEEGYDRCCSLLSHVFGNK